MQKRRWCEKVNSSQIIGIIRTGLAYLDRKLELVIKFTDEKCVTKCLASLHNAHNGSVNLKR